MHETHPFANLLALASGHAMLTAAVWHVLLSYGRESYEKLIGKISNITTKQSFSSIKTGKIGDFAFELVYLALIITVCLSRVYLACHFPHQCLIGGLLGWQVACFVLQKSHKLLNEDQRSRDGTKVIQLKQGQQIQEKHHGRLFISMSLLVLSTALCTYSLLDLLGVDSNWTIKLAMEHCSRHEYLHLETAPLFSLMRYSGFALGACLGLGKPISRHLKAFINYQLAKISQTTNSEENQSISKQLSGVFAVAADANGPNGNTNACKLATGCEPAAMRSQCDSKSLQTVNSLYSLSIRLFTAFLHARLIDNLSFFVSPTNTRLYYTSGLLAYASFSYTIVNI